jgi:hypothetical protein
MTFWQGQLQLVADNLAHGLDNYGKRSPSHWSDFFDAVEPETADVAAGLEILALPKPIMRKDENCTC